MARPKRISDKQILDAIKDSGAITEVIAQKLGINRTTLWRRVVKSEVIQEAMRAEEEVTKDMARKVVRDSIEKGSLKAAAWYLERKCRNEFGKHLQIDGNVDTTGQVHIHLPDNGRDVVPEHTQQPASEPSDG